VWLALSGVVALAFSLRMTVVGETVVDHPIRADAADYYLSAYNLVYHHTYSRSPAGLAGAGANVWPDAYRYPGLPLTIAALMRSPVDHDSTIHRVLIANAIAGTCAVFLVFVIGRRALPLWAAFAASLLTALSPHAVSFTAYVLTEPISTMLACALLTATALARQERQGAGRWSWLPSFGIGVVAGLLTTFRPVYLFIGPVVALGISHGRRPLRRAAALAALGTTVVMLPWFVRTAAFVPAESGPSYAALSMMAGAYPDYMLNGDPDTYPYPWLRDPTAKAATESVGAATCEIARRIASAPLRMANWYLFGKMRYLWQWNNIDGVGDVFIYPVEQTPFRGRDGFVMLHDSMMAIHGVLLALAVVGSILVWRPAARRNRGNECLRATSLLLAYTTVIVIPFASCTRYAVPVFPALFIMAMVALVAGADKLSAAIRFAG
jgi:4-amino-4-deoxy-L-arabinose transferase-like glycosyltransferase